MDSSISLKYHIRTFRLAGVWPENASKYLNLYNTWTFAILLTIGILFPMSQILNIFFSVSVSEVVERSVITSSVVVVVFKAINLYTKLRELNELFECLSELDRGIKTKSHVSKMESTIKTGHRLYFTYLCPYISTCVLLVFQTILSRPATRMWTSTYAFPFDWAHKTPVYIGGIFFQGISNTCVVIFAVAVDTYGVILIHILSTHIDIMQDRLVNLGSDSKLSAAIHLDQLIQCCKAYEVILRCSNLLEYTLGPALFAQFGVSGVVLCTSAYQLTVISPENVSKYAFVIVYFMCMMTEIFVPCYFGSLAFERSNLIGRKMFESNWIEQSEKYKRALRLFVEKSSQPIHLIAYAMFYLDLGTFLKILKTAYSMFALLKNV